MLALFSPLVRERSRVRFSLAAPFSKAKSALSRNGISHIGHSRAEQRSNTHGWLAQSSHSGFTVRSASPVEVA